LQRKSTKSNDIYSNRSLSLSIGIIFAIFLAYLFYQSIELLFQVIAYAALGTLGSFFIRRYGIWGKIITLFISFPIFLIPKSVWKSIEGLENSLIVANKTTGADGV
jgi:hypothetical protein